jgi:2-polyprenyl-3-methyl-5-hydroxy-6-metoxy-1,4-benzoquinol methylase
MQERLDFIVDAISRKNILHSKKIRNNLSKFSGDYFSRAGEFLTKYEQILIARGENLEYAVDCYLQMLADINYESVRFLESGEYSSKSFEEVNQRVYADPAIMNYYMHGLLLSQFLWPHHYRVLEYFADVIQHHRTKIKHYLEVGGGHGLYLAEAIRHTGNQADYTVVDISESSLQMTRALTSASEVNYILSDIYKFEPDQRYDFIVMGEVMEHVEDPLALLTKLKSLLSEQGKLFITTPTNAPAIDHIYLFRNTEEIRNLIRNAKYSIVSERCILTEDVPKEIAERFKVSEIYAATLLAD